MTPTAHPTGPPNRKPTAPQNATNGISDLLFFLVRAKLDSPSPDAWRCQSLRDCIRNQLRTPFAFRFHGEGLVDVSSEEGGHLPRLRLGRPTSVVVEVGPSGKHVVVSLDDESVHYHSFFCALSREYFREISFRSTQTSATKDCAIPSDPLSERLN